MPTPLLHPQLYSADRFAARLEEVFSDRLRIRWSLRRGAWLIESKVGRGYGALPIPVAEWDDSLIATRDGYAPVMAVQPGDRMPCPRCGLGTSVPICETKEIKCVPCMARGHDSRWMAAFYPLGEVLIDHLKKIDPLRREQLERVQAEERAAMKAKERESDALARETAHQFGDSLRDQMPKAGFPSLTLDSWRH
jgi:hypothetical protein